MLKKILLLICCFVWLYEACQAAEYQRPILSIDTLQYELGNVYQTDSVKVLKVHWKNTGNADLYIKEISPSCPCIIVNADEFENKFFKPGEEGIFIIKFDLTIPPQEFYKELHIYSNSTKPMESTNIYFHGFLHKDLNSDKQTQYEKTNYNDSYFQ